MAAEDDQERTPDTAGSPPDTGYPPPTPGYPPPHPGFPPPQPPYPPPSFGYPPPTPGYPAPTPGYPPPHPGFPPPQVGATPPQSDYAAPAWGYTEQQPGYAPPQPGYAPQQPGYAPPYGGYPPPGPGLEPPSTDGKQTTSRPRGRRIVLIVVAIVLVVGLLAGGGVALFGGSTSSSSSTPPASSIRANTPISKAAKKVLDQALAATLKAGSFHYVASSIGTSQNTTATGDAGKSSGRQDWSTIDSSGTAHFTVIVVGTACYFRGDALAMVENLAVSSAAAAAHAEQWISLAPGDQPYASVYAAVTTHDALYQNVTIKPQKLGSTTVAGRKVETVSGALTQVTIPGQTVPKQTGTGTLYVSAASHRPIRFTAHSTSDGQKSSFVMTFSRFGAAVDESAPSGAVSYASIGGASGQNGSGGNSPNPTFLT